MKYVLKGVDTGNLEVSYLLLKDCYTQSVAANDMRHIFRINELVICFHSEKDTPLYFQIQERGKEKQRKRK